jgi:hypothetical protein
MIQIMARWWVVLLLVCACSRDDKPAAAMEQPSPYEQEAALVRESFRRVLADFHGDVLAGRMGSAYARLAPAVRATLSLDRFTAGRSHPLFRDGVTFRVRRTSETAGTATVSALMQGPYGAGAIDMRCTRVDGVWKIAGISLDGTPVLPAP